MHEADARAAPFSIHCAPPFLTARFFAPQRTLGWSPLHPGFATIRDVVWLEIRGCDLPPDVDPAALLRAKLAEIGLPDALAFMTARDIGRHHLARHGVEDVATVCLTSVGLANGERIGSRRPLRAAAGTINTLVHASRPLADGALVEAISRNYVAIATLSAGDPGLQRIIFLPLLLRGWGMCVEVSAFNLEDSAFTVDLQIHHAEPWLCAACVPARTPFCIARQDRG